MGYYDHYRGTRRKRRGRIRIVLIVLFLLIVGLAAAFYFLQENAIFTADGFRLPFFQSDRPSDSNPPPQGGDPSADDVPLEIQDPEGNPLPDQQDPAAPEDEPPAEPDPASLRQPVAALLTDSGRLIADGNLFQQAQDIGYRQLAFQLKPADGLSLLDDGAENGVSDQSAGFLAALSQADGPKIAVFSALRDNVRPRRVFRGSGLHTASGATWLDYDYIAWFDPAASKTLESLTAYIAACEQAGFEQIVLQNFQYPVLGKLELLSYADEAARQADLTQLASRLREVTDLPLGIVLTEAAATGQADPVSGQDPAALAPYFDTMYVPAANFSADLSGLDAALEGTGCQAGFWISAGEQLPEGTQRDFIIVQ